MSREEADPEFEDLIHHIQQSRGVDFRGYKRTSLRRRILLRMQEVSAESFAAYQAFLEVHPQEFVELLNTVLINVTSFFRDAEAWEILRDEVVPRILARCEPDEAIRVWSVGCASGEEPYSMAILFAEALGLNEFCRRVKIYATDLDDHALAIARHASYGEREVEGVPAALLEKYFENTNGAYVVLRELRKSVIFGRHNVVFDAPISRIDLLSCRNLLIYLETDTQNVVLPRLHYALQDDGYLFLGKAETQLARSKLFRPLNSRHRIFSKVPQEWRRSAGGSLIASADPRDTGPAQQLKMLESIIDNVPTAHLVVDLAGTLIFANMTARRMLEVGEADIGRPFQDLPISYRPSELRSRIDAVRSELKPVHLESQEYLRPSAATMRLAIDIIPLIERSGSIYATLLSFTDNTRIDQLQRELEAAQESLETTIEELQSANEELETTNEELQSTNEELETTNEELQSTNEELETMNEELRSTAEEMEASNEELRQQSEDASRYRTHSESILRSINTGIIVLDLDLTVRSWNRWSENTWGMRADEVVGQPFLSLEIGLPVHLLENGLQDVTLRGEPESERVLSGVDRRGRPLTCRIRLSPLLYQSRTIHGLVLIAEDITEQLEREEYTRQLGRLVGQSLNEVYFLDPVTLRFLLVNKGAEKKLGYSTTQLRQFALTDFIPEVPPSAVQKLVATIVQGDKDEVVFETQIKSAAGKSYPAEICMQYFDKESPPVVLAIVHDTSQRQQLDS